MRPIPFLANIFYNQSQLLNKINFDKLDLSNIQPKEVDYNIIEQEYYNQCRIFRFKAKSNTSYDLELIEISVSTNIKLNNNLRLGNLLTSNNINVHIYDIGFTLTERNNSKMSYNEYYKKTNLFEQYEVFSRIAFILSELINNNEYKIFCIGKNIGTINQKICLLLYNNLFLEDYDFYEGESLYYKEGAYYFIKRF